MFPRIPLAAQACGLIREEKLIIVGTMAKSLACYTQRVRHAHSMIRFIPIGTS